MNKPVIGVSSCILGNAVRYDGGHKHNRFVTDVLGPFAVFRPVCPEKGIGLSVPRETLRLVKVGKDVTLQTTKTAKDYTNQMERFAKKTAKAMMADNLCGFIVQKNSPSCGAFKVKVYSKPGRAPSRQGVGLFTKVLTELYPNLPIEEDGRLFDPVLRENFFERVFAYTRLKELFRPRWHQKDVMEFQAKEKLLLMAHCPSGQKEVGHTIATGKKLPRSEFKELVIDQYMKVMAKNATLRKHCNVLQHIAGYFRGILDEEDRKEIHGSILSYKKGHVPLIVPVTLLKHHVRKQQVEYLAGQSYFEPTPSELMLRNHT